VVSANGYGRGGTGTHLKLAIHDEEEAALIRSQTASNQCLSAPVTTQRPKKRWHVPPLGRQPLQ
jgi:hypothetical protein